MFHLTSPNQHNILKNYLNSHPNSVLFVVRFPSFFVILKDTKYTPLYEVFRQKWGITNILNNCKSITYKELIESMFDLFPNCIILDLWHLNTLSLITSRENIDSCWVENLP